MPASLKIPLTDEEKARFMKRLTKNQWATARAKWETGEFTLAQLSEEFGISRESLSRRFTKDGSVKGSKKIEREIRDRLAAPSINEMEETARKIKQTKQEGYDTARSIAQLVGRTLMKAQTEGKPFGNYVKDFQALKAAAEAFKLSRTERWEILGLDKDIALDDEMPELVVRDLTEGEIVMMRQGQAQSETLFEDNEGQTSDSADIQDLPDDEMPLDEEGGDE